jgi:hypothetical protein
MPNNKVVTVDNLSRFKDDLHADFTLDITEAQVMEQATLGSIYNQMPNVLRVTTANGDIQMYKLERNCKDMDNKVCYSCLISGVLVELSIIESNGTYTVDAQRYD